MIRAALAAACLFACPSLALAGSLATAPLPPEKPTAGLASIKPGCSALVGARMEAHLAAVPLGYAVTDMDGETALKYERDHGAPPTLLLEHLTVLTNTATGRTVALLNDGPECAFPSVVTVVEKGVPPITAALDLLRASR